MTIVDYDKKMKIIEDFYNQVTTLNNIIFESIEYYQIRHCYNLLDNLDDINENKIGYSASDRKRQLLIELGRAGEYSMKYLLLLKQMQEYPNQSYSEFINMPIYKLPNGQRKMEQYMTMYNLPQYLVDKIKDEQENDHSLQPLHDYGFLFYLLKELYPNVVKDIYEVLLTNVKNSNIKKSSFPESKKTIMRVFSHCNWAPSTTIRTDSLDNYITEYNRIISESGDSFTRLRYIENNPNNKTYNFRDAFFLLDYLLYYMELLRDYNNNNFNKSISHAISHSEFLYLADRYLTIRNRTDKLDQTDYSKEGKKSIEQQEYIRVNNAFNKVEPYFDKITDSFNYDQISIYEQTSGKKLEFADLYNNILDNFIEFGDKPDILSKIPLLLDKNNNIEIIEELKRNKIDIEKVNKLERTIFCIPSVIFKKIIEVMEERGEKIIVDDKINESFFRYLEAMRLFKTKNENPEVPPPLPIRRIRNS